MAVHSNAAQEEDFAATLRSKIIDLGTDEDLRIRDAEVAQAENAIGEPAWRVLLRLDPPKSSEWSTGSLRDLRLQIRDLASAIADEKGVDLPFPILVETSAYEAPEGDTAPPDTPEPEEDTTKRFLDADQGSQE